MDIKECYDKMGADYENIFSRLDNAGMIEYLALKFVKDENMQKLIESLAKEDYQNAFMAVHTLKGLAMNLGFSQLEPSLVELTEEMRGGKAPAHPELLDSVKEAYEKTVKVLEDYQANK